MSAAPVPAAPVTTAAGAGVRRMYVSAGEPSGDEYLAALAAALGTGDRLELVGMAGPLGRAAGIRAAVRTETLTAMGFAEVIRAVPAHAAALSTARRLVRDAPCDVAVLVDYPGFHRRVATMLGRAGVPVLQYVAPQLWAWRPGRIAAWRAAVRHCAAILPFEAEYFNARGLPTTFVGHPLLDRVRGMGRRAARTAVGVSHAAPVLALFPGSRTQEVARMWPPFRDAARRLRRALPDLEVVVALSEQRAPADADEFRLVPDAEAAMAAADAVLCKSGTSTLLAAMCGTPMVVAYRAHAVSFAVARRLVTVPHIALVNVIAGRAVVPERLQHHANPMTLAAAVRPLLDDARVRERQLEAFAEVVEQLGRPGVAGRVVALVEEIWEGSGE